jgi:hypothetical protein
MMSLQADTFHMRTSEPFLCKADSRDEIQAQGQILLEIFGVPVELQTERNQLSMYLLMCHDHIALRRNMVKSELAVMFRG